MFLEGSKTEYIIVLESEQLGNGYISVDQLAGNFTPEQNILLARRWGNLEEAERYAKQVNHFLEFQEVKGKYKVMEYIQTVQDVATEQQE